MGFHCVENLNSVQVVGINGKAMNRRVVGGSIGDWTADNIGLEKKIELELWIVGRGK